MRVVRNYSEAQALELLNDLNSKLGSVYLPESGIIKQYIYWYIPIVSGFEYLFSESVLHREDVLNLSDFVLTGNPDVNTNFNLGIDITTNDIDISNNNLTTSVVDSELRNLINNFNNFNTDEFVFLKIGGDEDYPLYANGIPSASVIEDVTNLANQNKLEVEFWDGAKNVNIPNPILRIDTDNDYTITSVEPTFKGIVDLEADGNVFFMRKELFTRFATDMEGKGYPEGPFKCCVVFNNNLTITNVFNKPEDTSDISLNGLNLAYAPLDFFLKVISLDTLQAPDMTVWNTFLVQNPIAEEKIFRLFPQIDLSLLNM